MATSLLVALAVVVALAVALVVLERLEFLSVFARPRRRGKPGAGDSQDG
jgi:hypothetical protein